MKYDYSSVSNEYLIKKARDGCQFSKDLVFERNMPLVEELAERWKKKGSLERLDDLTSIGYLGLTVAYNTFCVEKGYKFTTYLGKVVWMEFIKLARSNSMVRRSKYSSVSIDTTIDDGDLCNWHEVVSDETALNDFSEVEESMFVKSFRVVINKSKFFSKKDKEILRLRYFKGKTFEEIGLKYGISRQAIQQTNKKCLPILKQLIG